jgi:hypothetical protein
MIIYATKLTFERYNIAPARESETYIGQLSEAVIEKEGGNRMLEWGAKLFYFDKRKSIEIVHFASKLTIFLVDIKRKDLEDLGKYIDYHVFKLYENDEQMTKALDRMFGSSPGFCLDRLTDRSIIATLNTTLSSFAMDGYRFYDFIRNGVLHSVEINRIMNFDWMLTMKNDGKTEYFMPGEKFRQLVLAEYGDKYIRFEKQKGAEENLRVFFVITPIFATVIICFS